MQQSWASAQWPAAPAGVTAGVHIEPSQWPERTPRGIGGNAGADGAAAGAAAAGGAAAGGAGAGGCGRGGTTGGANGCDVIIRGCVVRGATGGVGTIGVGRAGAEGAAGGIGGAGAGGTRAA